MGIFINNQIIFFIFVYVVIVPTWVQLSSIVIRKYFLSKDKVKEELDSSSPDFKNIKKSFDDIFKEVELKTLDTWNYMLRTDWYDLNQKVLSGGSFSKRAIYFLYIAPCSYFLYGTPRGDNLRVALLLLASFFSWYLDYGDLMLGFNIYLFLLALSFLLMIQRYCEKKSFRRKFDNFFLINRTDFYILFGHVERIEVRVIIKRSFSLIFFIFVLYKVDYDFVEYEQFLFDEQVKDIMVHLDHALENNDEVSILKYFKMLDELPTPREEVNSYYQSIFDAVSPVGWDTIKDYFKNFK